MNLPSTIETTSARLPESYENAKKALASCASVDECQQWADKAAALASYARQAEDGTLHSYAQRIQARAIKRAGLLLKQIGSKQGARTDQLRDGGDPKLTRTQAAADAGMSERQRKTALRVANVPDEDFERQVESASPPTITKLADQGKQKQPPRREFEAATHAVGALRRFVQESKKYNAETVAAGLMPSEVAKAASLVREADVWLDTFIVTLENRKDD